MAKNSFVVEINFKTSILPTLKANNKGREMNKHTVVDVIKVLLTTDRFELVFFKSEIQHWLSITFALKTEQLTKSASHHPLSS